MPQQGIDFNGFFIGIPNAYYADDVTAAGLIPPPVTPPLIVVGYGWGLKPKTPVTFVNPQNLLNALRGGPAATYVAPIVNPSPQLAGAQLITFIDASSNTQSTAALLASGGGAATLLTSVQYGPPSNLLSVMVQPGTQAGIKLTLVDNFAQLPLIGDNLTVPFQLAYAGAATSGLSYSVAYSSGGGTFTLTSPNPGESVAIPIGGSGYATVTPLIEAINGTGFFLAQGLSSTGGMLPATGLTATSGTLTAVSGTVPQYINVRAYLQDIPFWVNQFANTLVTATSGASALDTAAWLPVSTQAVFFSGARGVPPTNNDYAQALNVALTVPGWAVFCDSNAAGVMALLAQHTQTASSPPYGMWRRGFTGSSVGDSVATTIANALALDSFTMSYVYPGVIVTNTLTNQPTTYGGLYAAAATAGMVCGNPIPTALTNKTLNATGVEQTLTQSQLVELQNNGVMALYLPSNTNVPTILSDVTTWAADDNSANTSTQQVACRWWLAYTSVNAVRSFVGSVASPTTEVAILKALIRALNASIYTGGGSSGVLASWDTKSLQLVYTGATQLAAITFNATLVSQNKYITIFVPIQPLSITISAAA